MTAFIDSRDVQKRLAMYSSIAGALVAGTAQAAPTQSTSPDFPLTVTADEGSSNEMADFDIDGNGSDDLQLYVNYRDECVVDTQGYAYLNGSSYGGAVVEGDQYYAGMISRGQTVSDTDTYEQFGAYLFGCQYGVNNEGTDPGDFPPPSRGFVGVRFMAGENTHYGYLDVETFEGSVGVTIHSACFESTPDTAIEVAVCDPLERTAPVPVGGLIPLSLGVLALGAAALRRRRIAA